jgi:Flp pilus assembly protein TadD
MTLAITVASLTESYQAADFRLTDPIKKQPVPGMAQKQILVTCWYWHAAITFSGAGVTTKGLAVDEWLATQVNGLPPDAPYRDLVSTLLAADQWLRMEPIQRRLHTFIIAAFDGTKSVVTYISNHEFADGQRHKITNLRLRASHIRPYEPLVRLSGSGSSHVSQSEQDHLLQLLRSDVEPEIMHAALAELIEAVSNRDLTVGSASFTAHVRITGDSGGLVHGLDQNQQYYPTFADVFSPLGLRPVPAKDEHGRPKPIQLRQMAASRFPATEDSHRELIRDRPADPDAYSNYGAYLHEIAHDLDRADEALQRALRLNPNHCNALNNRAGVLLKRGDLEAAREHFERAHAAEPARIDVIANLADLHIRRENYSAAERVCQEGLRHASSEQLLLTLARSLLHQQRVDEASECFRKYREADPTDSNGPAGLGATVQMLGGDRQECKELYGEALRIDPRNAMAQMNLAQLLFLEGRDKEALLLVDRCLAGSPEGSIAVEGWLWRFLYGWGHRGDALSSVRRLVESGARSPGWDYSPNLERARQTGFSELALAEAIANVLRGDAEAASLETFESWRRLAG